MNNVKDIRDREVKTGVVFQVNKLLTTYKKLKEKGVQFYDNELERNGVGVAIPFRDPFGNKLWLMEVQIIEVTQFKEPVIYNFGNQVTDIEESENFYLDILGFKALTRKYLPNALPLGHGDHSFAFMLHPTVGLKTSDVEYPDECQIMLMFYTTNLSSMGNKLRINGIPILVETNESIVFKDPAGNIIEVTNIKYGPIVN